MPVTATGDISKTLENLEILVAASSTFQTAVGADDATAARAFVFWPGMDPRILPGEDAATYPWEFDTFPDVYAWVQISDGAEWLGQDAGPDNFYPSLPLRLVLVQATDATEGVRDQVVRFGNFVGSVVADMQALAKSGSYLQVTRFGLEMLQRSDPSEDDRYMEARITVQVW